MCMNESLIGAHGPDEGIDNFKSDCSYTKMYNIQILKWL